MLEEIRLFFGCGWIRKDRKTSKYEVRDLESLLKKIIPFFKKHRLRTLKSRDFEIFCEICTMLAKGSHFTGNGVEHLIDLAYSMNQNGRFRRKDKTHYQVDLLAKPKSLG